MTAWSQNYFAMLSRPVPNSPDLARIVSLPRRVLEAPPVGWEDAWRLPGCGDPACPYNGGLLPFQRNALFEAANARGLLASAGLGRGKTLVSLMLATALGAKRPVVMVPPSLREQSKRALDHLSQHWRIVPPEILCYSDLSNPKRWNCLEEAHGGAGPDLLVMDEVHCVASYRSARGKRMRRFMKTHSNVLFCGLSATPTKRSIRDYAPLFYWALRAGSPCPIAYKTLESWAMALDDLSGGIDNCPPGKLTVFGEPVRESYRRRMAETPGVVFTTSMSCDSAINCYRLPAKPTKNTTTALETLRSLWMLPDGTEFDSALDFARAVGTLAQGFWLRWTENAPEAWLEARKAWSAELRAFLGRSSRPGIDSPGLYEQAVANRTVQSTSYDAWVNIRDSFRPRTEAVWIDDYLVRAAAKWAETPGIVWARNPAWGRKVAAAAGIEYFGEGKQAEEALLDLAEGPRAGKCSVVLSLKAHGEGRNLQRWDRMLFPYPGTLAKEAEQAIGRCHRTGQKADEVSVFWALPCAEAHEALARTLENARYVEASFGQEQRLLKATWAFPLTSAQHCDNVTPSSSL